MPWGPSSRPIPDCLYPPHGLGGGRLGVQWLLASDDPSIRYLTLTEVLGRSPRGRLARAAAASIVTGPKMRALLAGQRKDGGFGVHPYYKWTGAHWRLVSMVDLAIPRGEPNAVAASETVLDWLGRTGANPGHAREVAGRIRRCASQEGNALGVCARLGMAADERVAGPRRSPGPMAVAGRWLELRPQPHDPTLLLPRDPDHRVGAGRIPRSH
jgi:hypothetical protein